MFLNQTELQSIKTFHAVYLTNGSAGPTMDHVLLPRTGPTCVLQYHESVAFVYLLSVRLWRIHSAVMSKTGQQMVELDSS